MVTLDDDGYVRAGGVKIARYLPDEDALEFVAPRSRRRQAGRHRVIVRLTDIAAIRLKRSRLRKIP